MESGLFFPITKVCVCVCVCVCVWCVNVCTYKEVPSEAELFSFVQENSHSKLLAVSVDDGGVIKPPLTTMLLV